MRMQRSRSGGNPESECFGSGVPSSRRGRGRHSSHAAPRGAESPPQRPAPLELSLVGYLVRMELVGVDEPPLLHRDPPVGRDRRAPPCSSIFALSFFPRAGWIATTFAKPERSISSASRAFVQLRVEPTPRFLGEHPDPEAEVLWRAARPGSMKVASSSTKCRSSASSSHNAQASTVARSIWTRWLVHRTQDGTTSCSASTRTR